MSDDNEENYRAYLAHLISQTKSRGHGRYFNQFVNRCRDKAKQEFPIGAKAAAKSDMKQAGFWGGLFAALDALLG
jgi:hypothetical protein